MPRLQRGSQAPREPSAHTQKYHEFPPKTHISPGQLRGPATCHRCPRAPEASPCPEDFSEGRRVRGEAMEVGESLAGTLNLEVTEKFTQNKLLFLTRKKKKKRISLSGLKRNKTVLQVVLTEKRRQIPAIWLAGN